MTPDVSIIIRCYNEEKHIARLLSGILAQNRKDVEIILVDSGSDDATIAIASNYPVEVVKIAPEKFSFGYSLNQGCAVANGKYLVFASAHVYPVYEDWISRLLKPFNDENVALSYGKQRGDSQTKYSEHQIFHKWFPDISCLDQKSPFCNNANAAIRKDLWKNEKYDEQLTGLEDLDWARKAIDSGLTIAYVSEAEVIHVHEESFADIFNRYRREAIALRHIYPDEFLSIWDTIKLSAANIWNDYLDAWHENVLSRNIISIPAFRLMQFIGGYRGGKECGIVSSVLKEKFYYPRGMHRKSSDMPLKQNSIDYSSIKKRDG